MDSRRLLTELDPGRRAPARAPPRRAPRSGSRTSSCRGAAAATSRPARRGTPTRSPDRPGGAQRAVREPAHRGQPAVLHEHDHRAVRRRRRVGRVGAAVDRRRGAALDRAPRLPHRDALARPGRARTGAHGAGRAAARCRSPDSPRDTARLRRAPGARDAHRAPQHRQAARRPGRLRGHEARRRRREPALPLLPRPRRRPRSRSTRRAWCSRSSDEVRTFEMPGTGIIDFDAPRQGHRPRRASTTSRSTTSRSSCRSCCGTGTSKRLDGLDAEAEAARDALVTRIDRIGTAGRRMAARRAESDRVAVSA